VPTVTKSINVAVPVRIAYDQWTQFETFPRFMKGVESVKQTDDTHSHWVTTIGGVKREFDTEITEQHPDERVAWKSTDGTTHAGVVTFHRLSEDESKVTVQLEWEAGDMVEKAGAVVGADDRQVNADLERFKNYIESQGVPDGAWRGDVSGGSVRRGEASG
jgi:uncharacterized membrane protein